MSVDSLAASYLKNFASMKAEVAPVEVVKLEDTHTTENVIIARTKEPRFYGGSLGKGDSQRPVWVHDMRQARHINGDLIDLYEAKLGEELFALWPYQR